MNVLLVVVDAVFRSSHLCLTALGRALRSSAHPKHRIKRVDRLLGNAGQHAARFHIYRHLADTMLARVERPVIVIDWTQLIDRYYALWAGVVYLGRTVPLYVEVHRLRQQLKRKAHERFLRRLREVIPRRCRPVLLVDAEFCTPFFDACTDNEFDFIVRVRGRCLLRGSGTGTLARTLARDAANRPRCAGKRIVYDAARQGRTLRIVVGAKLKRKQRRRLGTSGTDHRRRRALEPWVLATNIEDLTATRIVGLYAKRMQVEEMFRDVKDPRYGWALSQTGSRDEQRLEMLLLIGTLALVVALLVGAAAEQRRLSRYLQANTESRRRVLSLFRLGVLILAAEERYLQVVSPALDKQLRRLRVEQRNLAGPLPPTNVWPRKIGCTKCRRLFGHRN